MSGANARPLHRIRIAKTQNRNKYQKFYPKELKSKTKRLNIDKNHRACTQQLQRFGENDHAGGLKGLHSPSVRGVNGNGTETSKASIHTTHVLFYVSRTINALIIVSRDSPTYRYALVFFALVFGIDDEVYE